jgi:polysaccharide pyruvyl transferase WcaK-like protein
MHSAIAGLSQAVPTAGIAYSSKTAGVFGECGQRERVVDARTQTDEEVLESLWQSWLDRGRIRLDLSLEAPAIVRRAQRQWDEILGGKAANSSPHPAGRR